MTRTRLVPTRRAAGLTLGLALSLAAFGGTLSLGTDAPTAHAQKQPAQVHGTWTTTWGSERAILDLVQNGASITGRYTTTGAPPGTVSGTMDGTVLNGRWSDAGGGGGGFRLVFDPSARSFQGTWGSGASDVDGGSWNGTR